MQWDGEARNILNSNPNNKRLWYEWMQNRSEAMKVMQVPYI